MQTTDKLTSDSNSCLIGGVLVAAGASVCCLAPFGLLALGISGAWVGKLMILESYRPVFVLGVSILFAMAGWKIFRPIADSETGTACTMSQSKLRQKITFFLAGGIALLLLGSVYWIPIIA